MIILEYSEQQQAFHNNYGDTPPNTNGYKTLIKSKSYEGLGMLVKHLQNKIIKDRHDVTFDELKKEIEKEYGA